MKQLSIGSSGGSKQWRVEAVAELGFDLKEGKNYI